MAQTQKFKGTARTITTVPGQGVMYAYHRTAVVTVREDKTIRLDSGGYRTATTKLAMNQASNQDNLGFHVFQNKAKWFVAWQGRNVPYEDNMILDFIPVGV